jgi:hypothetical protein
MEHAAAVTPASFTNLLRLTPFIWFRIAALLLADS